jgi:hypothetical protein
VKKTRRRRIIFFSKVFFSFAAWKKNSISEKR